MQQYGRTFRGIGCCVRSEWVVRSERQAGSGNCGVRSVRLVRPVPDSVGGPFSFGRSFSRSALSKSASQQVSTFSTFSTLIGDRACQKGRCVKIGKLGRLG